MSLPAIITIHTLLTRIGIPDEDYRAMLWDRYKAASCKDLTDAQTNDLISSLHALLPEDQRRHNPRPQAAAGARRRFEKLGDRDGMATPKQLRMLEAAWVQRSRQPTLAQKQAAFREFLRTRFALERPEWIQREDVGRILRAVSAVDPDATPKSSKPKKEAIHGKN